MNCDIIIIHLFASCYIEVQKMAKLSKRGQTAAEAGPKEEL